MDLSMLQCHNLTGRVQNSLFLFVSSPPPPPRFPCLHPPDPNPLLHSVKQTNTVTPITANAADIRLHLWPLMKSEYVLWSFKLDHIKTIFPSLPDSSSCPDSELTISFPLVFQCDEGGGSGLSGWGPMPLWGRIPGSSLPTGHALCEWSQVTVSPGQQLKDAGSVSLNGGRVQSGFELSLNLPKVETV